MKDNEFIKKFVSSHIIEVSRYSCLVRALRDARKITGRDLKSGKIEHNILGSNEIYLSQFSFIGVINYLLILEMIGEVFRKKIFKTNKTNKVYKALKQFSNNCNKDIDIDVIIALRNSLAHNYGLVNIPNKKKEYPTKHKKKEYPTKRHIFSLDYTENCDYIIKKPTEPWDGNYSRKSINNYTDISVINLQDEIEHVYSNLKDEINIGNVELALKDGIDELKARFTVIE